MAKRIRGIAGSLLLGLLMTFGIMALGGGTAQAAPQYNYSCDFCHQMPPLDSATANKDPFTGGVPGNHLGHSSSTASSCVSCHGAQVTALDHRNKIIELNDSLGYSRKQSGVFLNQTSVPPNPLGTCSNISCHSDGKTAFRVTAPWGSSPADMNCSSCHGAAPDTGIHMGKHAAYFGTGTDSCVKCHANHLNDAKPFGHATSAGHRAIEVKFGGPNSGGTFATGQCFNLYCHSDGRTNPKTVSWAAGTTLDCSGCHGIATTTGLNALSAKHAKHVNNAVRLGNNYGCVDCHATAVSDNNTISDTTKHVDGITDLAGTKLGTVSAGSCATSYCHSNGKGTFKPATWTQGATIGCNGCHGTATGTGAPDYITGLPGAADANSHGKHLSSCADCHSKTTVNGTTIIAGSQHIDGFNNFSSGNGKTFGKLANKTCSNISCHSGNGIIQNVAPAQWGATLGCSGCHSTLTAGHAAHLDQYGCVDCHSTTVSSNTVVSNPATHLSYAAEVAGAQVGSYTLADKSCATSCHMSGAPKWNVPASGQCNSCHDVTGPLISTAAHAVHFAGTPRGPGMALNVASCNVCHVYNGERDALHANGINELRVGYNINGVCANCHKQSSTQWATAVSSTCDSCHSTTGGALSQISGVTAPDTTAAATSGHGRAGIGLSCEACHDKNSAHINGTLGDKRLLPALGSGSNNTECNFCHADSGKVSALNLNIKTHMTSGLGSLCADCHNAHGTAPNTMMVSQVIGGTAVSFTGNNTFANDGRTGVCQVCHITSQYFTKAGQPQTTHVDSTSNCLDCHSHNPLAGMAFSASGACDACHGYPPAPRQTLSAVTFGVQGSWSSAKFEDYSGGGGAHMVPGHVAKDLRLTGTNADWTPCLPCHFDGANAHAKTLPTRSFVENVNVTMDPQYRFSADHFMSYTSAKLVSGGANKSGTCFNTNCHMGPTPKWSTER
ncbi:MAG: CxxxxCH/CxxCH domain-containing protein [Desulfuromonadales bacterium]|nr:CxxxxCH/CxxCH domain-containing protein [Desulfuromonadales bacterium]